MKILCIGHASYDISCPVNEFPAENVKYRLNEVYEAGGGPACNGAYLLGKWGIDTYFAGAVGSDDYGNKIKKELESVQVKTNYLETSYDKGTSVSFILINKQSGSRTLFNISKDYPTLKKYDFMDEPDIIYVDGHEYNATMAALNKYPNAISVIDAGRPTPEVLEICKNIKHLVCSLSFAEALTKIKADYNNPTTLVSMYTSLKKKYPNSEVVVTLEDKGALYSIDDQIKVMPGIKTDVLDTTGAGDIFHGAYVYALSCNYPKEKVITYANIAAGLSVSKYGSRLSIPSLTEVINYYNEKFPPQPTQTTTEEVVKEEINATPELVSQVENEPVSETEVLESKPQEQVSENPIDVIEMPTESGIEEQL